MKTLKQAQVKSETELAVDAYLASIEVTYSVAPRGTGIKRDNWECDGWSACFMTRDGRAVLEEFDYFTGTGHRAIPGTEKLRINREYKGSRVYQSQLERAAKPFPPFAASVLHSLILDGSAATQTFESWCADYGMDNDSIKALHTYNECQRNADKLARIFNAEQREHLAELLQDY